MSSTNALHRYSRLFFVLTALALGGCDDHDPVVTQDTGVVRQVYQQLAQDWVQWAMGLPWSTGPVTDTTGARCAMGQRDGVWFLAGTPGGPVTRECTVPANTALFFPLINRWVIPPAEYVSTPPQVEAFLQFARGYMSASRAATCQLTLRIDGDDIFATRDEADDALYAHVLDPFPVDINDDNYLSPRPGGHYPAAVTDGHFALVRPLAPGTHTIEFGGATCDGTTVDFSTLAVYTLHVEAPAPGSHALTEADLMRVLQTR